mgnify:CR=1 FL=1
MSPAAHLVALLAFAFPASAPLLRLDVADAIVRAAAAHHVPVAIVAAVCFAESRLGTVPRYASLCGTRVHHAYVSGALSADIAARSLARRRGECGSWPRALTSYRWGRGCGHADTGYALRVLAVARRLGWQS